MTALCSTIGDVYVHYRAAAETVRKRHPGGYVLKTDCYNENIGRPVATGRTSLIDIDGLAVYRTRQNGYDSREGDIRDIPFDDDTFDAVLDLSTLDHIPPKDVPKAASEYARVLKTGGTLLLCVWLSFGAIEHLGSDQHFFRERVVEDALAPFDIEAKRDIYDSEMNAGCVLREYLGRKR